MARNLDMALLRTFVTVAETASMTAAANRLHLTQGAVSQQVGRLEAALGCLLLQRERRNLRLTPPGERLFARAKRLLGLNDEIWAEMAADLSIDQVRLGLPYDLVGARLTPALKAYAAAFPRAEIVLTCGSSPELAGALAGGRLDLAVVEEPAGPSAGECLGVEQLVWVGARGGMAHRKRPLPVSMVDLTCAFRPAVLAALQGRGIGWRTVFESGSLEATVATVRADLTVTTWLACTVPDGLSVLPAAAGLPALPAFSINLHRSRQDARHLVAELAAYIRAGFTGSA